MANMLCIPPFCKANVSCRHQPFNLTLSSVQHHSACQSLIAPVIFYRVYSVPLFTRPLISKTNAIAIQAKENSCGGDFERRYCHCVRSLLGIDFFWEFDGALRFTKGLWAQLDQAKATCGPLLRDLNIAHLR